jgi:hypothetical protein
VTGRAAHDLRNAIHTLRLQLVLLERTADQPAPAPEVLTAQVRAALATLALLDPLVDLAEMGEPEPQSGPDDSSDVNASRFSGFTK